MAEPKLPPPSPFFSFVFFVGAVIVLSAAFILLRNVLGQANYGIDDFVVPGFLLIAGAMLLGASRAARHPRATRPAPGGPPPPHIDP